MGGFSIWHWLIVFFVLLLPNLLFVPAIRRTGFSGWWIGLACVPLVNLVLLWVWAYSKWPAHPER